MNVGGVLGLGSLGVHAERKVEVEGGVAAQILLGKKNLRKLFSCSVSTPVLLCLHCDFIIYPTM